MSDSEFSNEPLPSAPMPPTSFNSYVEVEICLESESEQLNDTAPMPPSSFNSEVEVEVCSEYEQPIDSFVETNWSPITGHSKNFRPYEADPSKWILKRFTKKEHNFYRKLMEPGEPLRLYVAVFDGVVTIDETSDDSFLKLQNLTSQLLGPYSLMDIKMGTRTYLECETWGEAREDLYSKMVAIDPNEPTDEETRQKAVNKGRYMAFRDSSR